MFLKEFLRKAHHIFFDNTGTDIPYNDVQGAVKESCIRASNALIKATDAIKKTDKIFTKGEADQLYLHANSTAKNSNLLNNKDPDYYLNASHMNAGMLPDSRLPKATIDKMVLDTIKNSDQQGLSITEAGASLSFTVDSQTENNFTNAYKEVLDELAKDGSSFANAFLPGMIMIWAGQEDQIPDGWQLCNGQGTTSNGIKIPDLQGRMVTGSGGVFSYGMSGGSTVTSTNSTGSHEHELTITGDGIHTHAANINGHTLSELEMPVHKHIGGVGFYRSDTMLYGKYSDGSTSYELASKDDSSPYHAHTSSIGGGNPHNHAIDIDNSNNHNHLGSSMSNTGDHEHTVDIMPPFYVLAFIIKL